MTSTEVRNVRRPEFFETDDDAIVLSRSQSVPHISASLCDELRLGVGNWTLGVSGVKLT